MECRLGRERVVLVDHDLAYLCVRHSSLVEADVIIKCFSAECVHEERRHGRVVRYVGLFGGDLKVTDHREDWPVVYTIELIALEPVNDGRKLFASTIYGGQRVLRVYSLAGTTVPAVALEGA